MAPADGTRSKRGTCRPKPERSPRSDWRKRIGDSTRDEVREQELPGVMHKLSAAVGLFLLTTGSAATAQSLSGSRAAMIRQNSVAHQQDYTFLRNTSEVRSFVDRG